MLYEYFYPQYYNDRNKTISSIIPRLEKKNKRLRYEIKCA